MVASSVSYEVRVALRDAAGGLSIQAVPSLAALRDRAALERLEPVRAVQALRHKVGRVRYQPVLSLDLMVACDSRLEALRVIELERAGGLVWIVGQPLQLVAYENGRVARRHVPDLLYGLDDGRVVLENVRPLERRSAAFVAQEALCERIAGRVGWSYSTVGSYPGMAGSVLMHLWGYAVVEPRVEVVERVVGAFRESSTWPLRRLVERCGRWEVAYPCIMALIWRGHLEVSLEARLDAWSLVAMGPGVEA